MSILEVTAPDITCAKCKENIETDLAAEPGVQRVDVGVDDKRIRVVYDDSATTQDALLIKLADIGYPAASA